MAQDIFIHSHHSVSDRLAIFEDDTRIAYLYLTKPNSQQPEKDAVVYTRVQPVEQIDWDKIRETGEVPPLSKDVASSAAVIQQPDEDEFSFRWSSDGESVAVLRNGTALAFTSAREKLGYSRAISKATPLANPWSQELYDMLFNE